MTVDYKLLIRNTDGKVQDISFDTKKTSYICSSCGKKEKDPDYNGVDDGVVNGTKNNLKKDSSGFLQSKCGGFEWNGHVVGSIYITNNSKYMWRAIKEATLTCARCGERKEWNEPWGWVHAVNIKCKCGNDDFIVLTSFEGVLVPVLNNSDHYPFYKPFMDAVCSKCFEPLEEKLPWPPGLHNVTTEEARQRGMYAQACTLCGNKIMHVYTVEITKLIADNKIMFYEKKWVVNERVLCKACGGKVTPWMYIDENHNVRNAILGGLLGAATAGAAAAADAMYDNSFFKKHGGT